MKLGTSSYTFPWAVGVPGYPPPSPFGPLELLQKTAALGVGVLQVCDNLPLDRLVATELDTFQRRAHELGVSIEVGTRGVEPERLLTYLRLAERLGSPIVRLVTDIGAHQPGDDELVRLLAAVMPAFAVAGVTLAIENHGRHTAAQLLAILERLGSPYAGICLDTTNSFGALEMPQTVVETLASRTVNLHIKDFTIRRLSHQFGYVIEGCPAGQGWLDVPWVLQRLRQEGRDYNAILELWTPPEETLAATIAKQEAWAAESVAYLRQFIRE